jgi:hypothetical protein
MRHHECPRVASSSEVTDLWPACSEESGAVWPRYIESGAVRPLALSSMGCRSPRLTSLTSLTCLMSLTCLALVSAMTCVSSVGVMRHSQ